MVVYLSLVIYFQDVQERRLEKMFKYSEETVNINKQGSEVVVGRLLERAYGVRWGEPGYRIDYIEYYQTQSELAIPEVGEYLNQNVCPSSFPTNPQCPTIGSGILLFGINKAFNAFLQLFTSNSFTSPE